MKKFGLTVTLMSAFALASPAFASGQHEGGHDHDKETSSKGHSHESDMSHGDNKMFLEKRSIDGYDVSFHVMAAQPGKEMGGSHDFMIKVEKSGKVVTNVAMNTKVIHPDGKSESKAAMKMGDWMMAGYDMGQPGKYQLMILFKTADGEKHKGGVYYSSPH